MPTELFFIVLTGKLKEGRSPDQAAVILSKAFGIPVEQGRTLFNGAPTPMGKKLEKRLAEKVMHLLQEAGAGCELKEVQGTPQWSLVEMEDKKEAKEAEPEHENVYVRNMPPATRSLPDDPSKKAVEDPGQKPTAQARPPHGEGHKASSHRSVIQQNEGSTHEGEPAEGVAQKPPVKSHQLALVAMFVLLLAGASYFLLFPGEEAGPEQVAGSQPQKTSPALDVSNLNDPALRDSEMSLTKLKLKSLAQSVRVWMLQFGGGYDTDQVTISRLQRDMGVSDDDLTDAWGTKILYQPSKSEFSISSAGPDKTFGTADDVIVLQKR